MYVGLYLPIKVSVGETTNIHYLLNFISKINANILVSWGATVGTTAWAWGERKKRLQERKERDDRIIVLEKQIDPNRTSSNLTTSGTAPKRLVGENPDE